LLGEETPCSRSSTARPFPRIAPPYRRGVDEIVETRGALGVGLVGARRDGRATVTRRAADARRQRRDARARRVTLAEGADWFREVGTQDSPGTVLCTVRRGSARRGREFAMARPSARSSRRSAAAAAGPDDSGVLQARGRDHHRRPARHSASWEGMQSIGSGLARGRSSCSTTRRHLRVAASVSRFLAVESCGQCTPCKQDGLLMSDALAHVAASHGTEEDFDVVRKRIATVADSARCSLATQHES